MDDPQAADPPHLTEGYAPPPGVADELMLPDGTLRPVWRPFIDYLSAQTSQALAERFAHGGQYLHDAGVFYRQVSEDGPAERDWPLSHLPVLIAGDEWQALADGIVQRAELLERVMADLYGPGDLVRGGLIPAELVARNPEWLRPIVGARPASGHFLHFLAFEVGRSPDGSWFVLADRTQAPSGSGFAIENRMATTRVFQDFYADAHVERLAGFFQAFRDAMNGLRGDAPGRAAILTPGQTSDSYFEHAYIARYLGVMLLEAEDLTVEGGHLMVRTITGTEPVRVLWRRMAARLTDPLEFDAGEGLGTPGMVAALRAGGVAMLNCLGSGVLEAPALLAFLPRIAEALTGEPLRLPNIATWWCGQAYERGYVAQNADTVTIRPALDPGVPVPPARDEDLAARLQRDGANLVGQEAVRLSTTPAMVEGRLVPRPTMVRVFAARTPQGWIVMPGGYARIGGGDDVRAPAMQGGGSVADVWVVADAPVATPTLTGQAAGPFTRRMPGRLPSRAADNLYWLGRYVARAEARVREIRAYHMRLEETGPTPVTDALAAFALEFDTDVAQPVPDALLALFDAARGAAGKVRDRFSTDGWHALGDLADSARSMAGRTAAGHDTARAMSELLRKLAGFSGLVTDNMFHFTGWRFLTMGRALERGDHIAALLARFAELAAPIGGFEVAIEVGDSVMTHRRRYSVELNRNTVVDLLALDEGNPRSILFQLETLRAQERHLPPQDDSGQRTDVARAILRMHADLSVAMPEEMTSDRLLTLRGQLQTTHDALTARYLG